MELDEEKMQSTPPGDGLPLSPGATLAPASIQILNAIEKPAPFGAGE
jgi:hypothetical protein